MLKRDKTFIPAFLATWATLMGWTNSAQGSNRPTSLHQQYLQDIQRFSTKTCPRNAHSKYDRFFSDYRGKGYFVPLLRFGRHAAPIIDWSAIDQNLPLLEQKIEWLRGKIQWINNSKALPPTLATIYQLEETISILSKLNLKIDLHRRGKKKLARDSQKQMDRLQRLYQRLLSKIPYVLSFQHPVDHLKNRQDYEIAKNSILRSSDEVKKNSLFFTRKILEDGSYNKRLRSPDLPIRSTLDTISLKLEKSPSRLTPDLQFDLEWTLERLKNHLPLGKPHWLGRLTRWESRLQDQLQFYRELKTKKNVARQVLQKQLRSNENLRNFIIHHQARVYKKLSDAPISFRQLWIFDQILMHEVGNFPGATDLDRKEMIDVVLNRISHPTYSELPKDSDLAKKLAELYPSLNISKHPALNAFFRPGEFSFTYYFIPGAIGVICPDLSPLAKRIRRNNIELIEEHLKIPISQRSEAMRYFSRISMLGKIDMSSIWKNYEALPELPGETISQSLLKKRIKNGDFDYLYSFETPRHIQYSAIRIGSQSYAVRDLLSPQPNIRVYRDPNVFKFFKPISPDLDPVSLDE